MKSLLVISTTPTKNVETMVAYLRSSMPDVTIDYVGHSDLVVSFIDGTMHVAVTSTGKDLRDYDMAYFKSSVVYDITASLVQYASQHNVKITDESKAEFPGVSKLYEYTVLAHAGINVPDSIFMLPKRMPGAYEEFAGSLGMPFILKDIHASRGNINEVIRSQEDYDRVVQEATGNDTHYLIGQKFVPNNGDYRILVFGGDIKLVIHRQRPDDSTHLNNTSQGGRATLIDAATLPATVKQDSITAARALKVGIAGVDMVQDRQTEEWYCFEVNEGPQMATGSHREAKWDALSNYLITELEK
jgi:glutathione synthase/RimK-type ligase-like ATP-grasp enzyme